MSFSGKFEDWITVPGVFTAQFFTLVKLENEARGKRVVGVVAPQMFAKFNPLEITSF